MADNILVQEENRGIHRLVMDHGPNALDPALMSALRKSLSQLVEEGAPSVVLASTHPNLFCPGWNLKLLADAGRKEVGEFLESFNHLILDLFSYPGPTAAAIGGHAVAAGCLLSRCELLVAKQLNQFDRLHIEVRLFGIRFGRFLGQTDG